MLAKDDFKATAFEFVQQLARDLSSARFELPGFPDVVMRLHTTLADERCSAKDVVNLISSEPTLSAQLIQMANSAAFNADGRAIADPRTAIQRLGFNIVRSTATTFAVKQLENQEYLKPVRSQLSVISRRSNAVAASGYVIAEFVNDVRTDEALATGLFHQIGNLYLLARGHKEGMHVIDNPDWDELVSSWHPTIARAIMESWGMPESIAEAVENQDGILEGEIGECSELTRLLSAAKLSDILKNEPDEVQPGWKELLVDVRLSGKPFCELLEKGREKIAIVSQTIG